MRAHRAARLALPRATADPGTSRQRLRSGLITAALILAAGSLVPFSELPFPERYADVGAPKQIMAELVDRGLLEPAGLTLPEVRHFMTTPQAWMIMGRGLYPRYYEARRGENSADAPTQFLDYPRLTFTLIGPQGERGVILPGQLPIRLANASDVIVLGCRNEKTIDALAIFVLSDPAEAYVRWP